MSKRGKPGFWEMERGKSALSLCLSMSIPIMRLQIEFGDKKAQILTYQFPPQRRQTYRASSPCPRCNSQESCSTRKFLHDHTSRNPRRIRETARWFKMGRLIYFAAGCQGAGEESICGEAAYGDSLYLEEDLGGGRHVV